MARAENADLTAAPMSADELRLRIGHFAQGVAENLGQLRPTHHRHMPSTVTNKTAVFQGVSEGNFGLVWAGELN